MARGQYPTIGTSFDPPEFSLDPTFNRKSPIKYTNYRADSNNSFISSSRGFEQPPPRTGVSFYEDDISPFF